MRGGKRGSMKKAIFLSLVLIILCCTNKIYMQACEKAEQETVLEEYDYVRDIIPQYLTANDLYGNEELYLSARRVIYNWDTGTEEKACYYVFTTERIVGELVVQRIDGLYYSSFKNGCREIINDLYREERKFVLGNKDGNLILCTEEQVFVLESAGISGGDEFKNTDIAETGISEPLLEKQLCKIAKDKGIDLNAGSAKAVPRALIYTPGGQPPFVANDNYGGIGLCWAASTASVINYKNNNAGKTAMDIYMQCWETVGYDENRKPNGGAEWIKTAFTINGYSVDYKDSNLSTDSVATILAEEHKPIIMTLYGYEGSKLIGHAVVLFEFADFTGAGYFKFIDPNESHVITMMLSKEMMEDTRNIKYVVSPALTYTFWTGSFY